MHAPPSARPALALALVALPALSRAQSAPLDLAPGAATAHDPSPSQPRTPTVRVAPGRGLTVTSDDGRTSLTLRGTLQLRVSLDAPAPPTTPPSSSPLAITPAVRRARLIVQGTLLGPSLGYTLQLGVSPQEQAEGSPLFDAFVDWRPSPGVSLRVGQFFVPFNRNRWIPIARQLFIERPISTQEFNLDRDAGALLALDDLLRSPRKLSLSLGAFGGAGRNRVDPDHGLLYLARLGFTPLGPFDDHDTEWDHRREGPRLALGLAAAFNHRARRAQSTIGADLAPGERVDYAHITMDLLFKHRGLSLQLEGIARWRTDRPPGAIPGRDGVGYVLQGGYRAASGLGLGARWSQTFPLDPASRTDAPAASEAGAILAYHALDGALTLGADYNARITPGSPLAHGARAQAQLAF